MTDELQPREGTIAGLRARHQEALETIGRLKRDLSAAEAETEKVRQDAEKLGQYIRQRVGDSVWAHVDMMLIVGILGREFAGALKDSEDLRAAGTLASHVTYQSMLTRRVRAALRGIHMAASRSDDMQRPDMIREDMAADMGALARVVESYFP